MTQEHFGSGTNSQEETNEIIGSKSETSTEAAKRNAHLPQFEISKLETELFALNTDRKGLTNYIEKVRHADPNEKIPIFHGTRGGYSEILSILQSEEKGVRGGKIGGTPTYAIYPIGAYWIQADSAGFKYVFERRQIQLPEEPETFDTVIKINELGLAFITKGLDHLSLVDFEGEVMLGPRAEVSSEITESIGGQLLHIRTMAGEIKPIMHAVNEQMKAAFDLPTEDKFLESHPGVRLLQERLFSLLPLTYKQYQNKIYERRLTVTIQYADQEFEKIQRVIEQEQDLLDRLKKDGGALSATLKKVNSRNRLFWLSRVLARRFIEKQAPENIKERLLDTFRGKEKSGELAEKIKSKLLSYVSMNESQLNFTNREIEKYHKEREYYIHVVEAVAKVKDILQSYESTFAQKIYPFHSEKIVH